MNYQIKPIKNENDYNAALQFLETIINAEEGTAEADIRDVMSILIEKYEEEKYYIDLPDPVEAIKFRMEQQGLHQKDLIAVIGSRSKVSEILSGKKELSLKMMRALHQHLGIPAEVLLRSPKAKLPDEIKGIDFTRFPLAAMKKMIDWSELQHKNIHDFAEEAVRFLIRKIGGLDCVPTGLFRKKEKMRLNAKLDNYALFGWCLIVLSKASEKKGIRKYNEKNISKTFLKNLVGLSVLHNGPKLAQELLSDKGIILEIVPHFRKTYLDGASFILKDGRPVIGLTIRYDKLDNFWFVLFHEIGHIIKHLKEPCTYFADDITLRGIPDDNDKEKEADHFAETTLLPADFGLDKEYPSKEEIIEYAHRHNVHPAIVAGRIQYIINNYRMYSNLIGRGEVRKCFPEVFG
jgi:HTH-type transcriptional regulator/antitoxin HigA